MPKVSVIIPSYNHEAYVRAAVDSVLTQTFQDLEVVVTDDGSKDRTAEIVGSIGDKRVSLEKLPRNYGVCIASNNAIRRAKGDYLAFLCSDDIFLPDKLAKQVRLLDDHRNVGLLTGWPRFMNEAGETIDASAHGFSVMARTRMASRHEWLRRLFFHGNAICASTVMVRRECFEKVGLHNPALAQLPDMEMWVRLLAAYDMELMEEELVAVRIRGGDANASAWRPEVAVRDFWEWRKVLEQYLNLDDELLVRVFPELANRRMARQKAGFISRLALKGLQRYLPAPETARSEPSTLEDGDPRRSLRWGIAELALEVGRPSHVLFAFDTMYAMLGEAKDKSIYREFIDHTGSYDPLGALFNIPQNRAMATWPDFGGSQPVSKKSSA
jgi:glycosyltransferase involved in cell wall biosynthesis